MQSLDDSALLSRYAENHSDEAFAALVTRHINLVYSVALRKAGNPQRAEEITQAVFIILAKKALPLRHDKALSSWLFQATQLTANNFVRSEARRHRREQEAYMQTALKGSGEETWRQIGPLLDTAVASLNEKDRRAIVLRFYEGRNLIEVGAALGASEEAAKKRVARALEKLRHFFAKRGVVSTTASLAGTISAHSVQAAPVTLAKSVTVAAMAKGAAASGSTLTLIQGALKVMAWTKAKTAIVAGIIVLLTAGTATVTIKQIQVHTKNRQIAAALLAMHESWANNGYHATREPLPPILAGLGEVRAWSAGILGAYVEYAYVQNGKEWTREFHLYRNDTNTTKWTLFESGSPVDTNLSQMTWQRTLTTVMGKP